MISKLEQANIAMKQSGLYDTWFGDADLELRGVTKEVNGALFEALLRATKYSDVECVELLRSGRTLCRRLIIVKLVVSCLYRFRGDWQHSCKWYWKPTVPRSREDSR